MTVNGSQVTVTPTDSTGRTFDVQTYDFSGPPPPPPPDTTPPTAPGQRHGHGREPDARRRQLDRVDGQPGVEGYNITRDGALVATVTSATSWSDTTVTPGTTYHYAVSAYDAARNASPATAAPAVTTPNGGSPRHRVRPPGRRAARPAGRASTCRSSPRPGDALVAAIAIQAGATASVTGVTDSRGRHVDEGRERLPVRLEHAHELWYRTGAPR